MKIGFTKDQGTAINARGSDLLVSASAGSGKTTVMVERIASMIESGECEYKDLLVLTFTNASADDMRRKLRRRLENHPGSLSHPSKEGNISDASIGTFHKFCGEVVRTYFNIAGVSPDFGVLDEVATTFLKAQVLDEVIAQTYEKCAQAIETFCVNRKTDMFQKMIIRISEFLASRGDAQEWLDTTAVVAYETDVALNAILDYYRQAGEYYARKFDDEECKGMALLLKAVASYQDLHEFANTANFTRLKRGADEEFKKTREQFKELVKKMEPYKLSEEVMKANGKRDREIIKQVIHIVREFDTAYGQAKLSANKLDFNDLEKYACVVLSEVPYKYKYVFIDEYQDTNPMQERILAKLANHPGSSSHPSKEGNIFMVGDVKQSIYGFRGCEATIFVGKMTNNKVVYLNENFRSRQNILKFANLVFGKVMKDGTCDIDYDATSKFEVEGSGGVVDVTLVNGRAIDLQAEIIAQKIKALNVPLKDIAILSRSRTHFDVLTDTLEKAGIAVNVAAEQDACELPEIALLNNMLFAVSNFYNDVPLVLTMQGVFGFTPQQLAEMVIARREATKQSSDEKEPFYKSIHDEKFLAFLDKYHALTKTHSVVDVLTTFITEYKISGRYIHAYLNKLRDASYATTVSEFLYLLENELVEIKITSPATGDAVQIMTMHGSKGLEFPNVIIFDVGAQFNLNDVKQLMVIDKKCGLCVYTHDAEEFTKTMSIARLGATISARRVLVAEEMRLLYVAMTRTKERLIIVGGGKVGSMGCDDYDIPCAKCFLHFLAPTLFEQDECFELTVVNDVRLCEVTGPKQLAQPKLCLSQTDQHHTVPIKLQYPYPQVKLKNSVSSLTQTPRPTVTPLVIEGVSQKARPQQQQQQQHKYPPLSLEGCLKGGVSEKSGKEYGTQFHKEMQHLDISELEKLIPEIKGYIIYREIVFLQSVGDIIVQGVIDLLAVKDGHAIIVDYKTTRATAEKLVEMYKPQLDMYADAVRQGTEVKEIDSYIYSTFNKNLVKLPRHCVPPRSLH